MTPRILVIAGSDSGGGAGIQADIKTITMLGGHAMTAVTAITAQNTLGVQRVMPVPTDMVMAQIESVVCDIGVDAVKIGMLGSAATAQAVADWLATLCPREGVPGRIVPRTIPERAGHVQPGTDPDWAPAFAGAQRMAPIILDPVMVATSGDALADPATIVALERLMRLATVVTPNLPELAALGGEAALRSGSAALLVKGGHGEGDEVVDELILPDGRRHVWRGERIVTRSHHGTGCTLASAIATGLGAGLDLPASVERAIRFVRSALIHAPDLGHGHGPMGHGLGVAPFDVIEDPCRI